MPCMFVLDLDEGPLSDFSIRCSNFVSVRELLHRRTAGDPWSSFEPENLHVPDQRL